MTFVTICQYVWVFATIHTIQDYSHYLYYLLFTTICYSGFPDLVLVVQKTDNAIHQINHYPVDSVVCFLNTYLLDSDLSFVSAWNFLSLAKEIREPKIVIQWNA